jgi:hypothetical protein
MSEMETNDSDLYSVWKEFNSAVQGQMADAIEAGQDGYKQLHESWSDMAKGMAEFSDLLDPTVPETMEVYNVWRNYSAKMARRMDIVMNERQDRFNSLFETWGDWTSTLGKDVTEGVNGDSASMFERTYLDWLIFSGRFLAEIVKSKDMTGSNVEDLVKTWKLFSKTMTDALARLVKNGGENYRDVSQAWLVFIDAVGENLDDFTNGTEKDFTQLYETWLRESQSLGRKMAQAIHNGMHESSVTAIKSEDDLAKIANGTGGSK